LQSRFFPGNAGFQPASEFVGILPAQGGDSIPQPSRRLEACVPRDFAILLQSRLKIPPTLPAFFSVGILL
ncbi:MAG: hypothetical protein FWC43_11155, partial [Planctomycetaceae bacterium]|nr:hypothetical protein [Planctomycetaceae bacterium]